jgi:ribosomal protein S12 methylthiotransferase accessory factor
MNVPRFHGTRDPARKTYLSGTHRSISPEKTLERAWPFMPVMGVTRLANVTGLDSIGIPVVMVCRPNSRSVAVSQGKGLDLTAAKASGLMETVESYHAEHLTLPLKLGSYEELRYTHPVVDVTALPLIAGSRFRPNLRILWIEGHDLLQETPVWVPYEMVHTDYTVPPPPGSGCFMASSNGLASGNHPLEAISHGICEVVERDAVSIWHRRDAEARHKTRIDLDSVDPQACREVLAKYERAGIGVAVWDTTTDVGIPSFLCMISERPRARFFPIPSSRGMGCHPARDIALLRALTEAAQSRLTLISGARDDLFRRLYELGSGAVALQTDWARIQSEEAVRSFRDVASWEGDTFEEDVAWELDRLRPAGIERVVVVDLTKPEFGLPVVRVVIPGLEGPDLSPGYSLGARARAVLEGRT